jgi:hypothetical protein
MLVLSSFDCNNYILTSHVAGFNYLNFQDGTSLHFATVGADGGYDGYTGFSLLNHQKPSKTSRAGRSTLHSSSGNKLSKHIMPRHSQNLTVGLFGRRTARYTICTPIPK